MDKRIQRLNDDLIDISDNLEYLDWILKELERECRSLPENDVLGGCKCKTQAQQTQTNCNQS